MIKIDPKDIYVSIVDLKKKQELLSYDLKHNLEIANFSSPTVLDSKPTEDIEAFSNLVKSKGADCSLHGPVIDLNYESRDPDIQAVVRKRYHQILDVAEKLSAKYIILHSTYNPQLAHVNRKERWLEGAINFFPEFVKKAEEIKTILLIENIFDTEPEPINTLIKTINSPNFKICIDIGHHNLFSKIPIKEWVDTYGEDLAYFHLHDNKGEFDDHMPMGSGTVQFEELFEALKTSPAELKYCIEVRTIGAIDESLAFLKKLNVIEGV